MRLACLFACGCRAGSWLCVSDTRRATDCDTRGLCIAGCTGPRATLHTFLKRSYGIPGAYAPPWSEKRTSLLKAIEKEGLQGGKGDSNWVVRHRQIHDPGIQQEPNNFGKYHFDLDRMRQTEAASGTEIA